MRESYCGLCEDCELGAPDFLEALAMVKEYLYTFRVDWWAHCFPGDEGFSLPQFHQGLDWFLSHTECSGCKGVKGLDPCPIRLCAMRRHQRHCYECPDFKDCEKFSWLTLKFSDQKDRLRRRQLNHQARKA